MIIIIGLVILVAAVVAGVAGVLGNGGSGHAVTHFAVFGYHVTGSTGTLFLYGIVVGALGLFGPGVLLAGARRTSRRGSAARRGLRESRRETAAVSQDRDNLISQREAARAYTSSTPGNGAAGGGRHAGEDGGGGPRSMRHFFGRRPASPQAAAQPAPAASGQPASDTPAGDVTADASAPAE
jgi:hypothetical protein